MRWCIHQCCCCCCLTHLPGTLTHSCLHILRPFPFLLILWLLSVAHSSVCVSHQHPPVWDHLHSPLPVPVTVFPFTFGWRHFLHFLANQLSTHNHSQPTSPPNWDNADFSGPVFLLCLLTRLPDSDDNPRDTSAEHGGKAQRQEGQWPN